MPDVHWIRKCKVNIGGTGLDMSNMHIEFQVRLYDQPNPDWCYIRMFNLSDQTSDGMFQKGANVRLEAGYEEGSFGLIFSGTATQMRRGKLPNGVDKYHDVVATVNRDSWNYALVSKTFDSGGTIQQLWEEVQKAFQEKGASAGFIAQIGQSVLERGFTFHGLARDLADMIARTTNSSWHFDHEGKLNLVKNDGFLGGDTMEINADTGMVGLPEQTLDGINVKIFLNPNVRKDQKVHVDEKSIQRWLLTPPGIGGGLNIIGNNPLGLAQDFGDPRSGQVPKIAKDGMYKVVKVDHDGSLEGQEWYTTLICIALDDATSKFGGSGGNQQQSERDIPEDQQNQGGGQGAGGSGGQ